MAVPARKKTNRAATLVDVGKAAGVSAMAVSAVLNGAQTSARISSATRERILKAAADLRYRPNAAARALADRRMNTLGVAGVIEGGAERGELNTYFLEIFNGVIEGAAVHEQNTTVFTLHDWDKDAARLSSLCDGRIDGVVLIAPMIHPTLALNLPDHTPFVSLHSNFALPGVINLESDEEEGAFEMVRYLASRGHRRIVHLTGDAELLGAERRIRGYKRALAAAGIPFDPALLVTASYNSDAARASIRAWMKRISGQPLPDAVFGANDGIAVACLEIFAELGIRVPDDVSVAGFDDTIAARTTMPQLTTVRQPLRAMGRRAVTALLDLIKNRDTQERSESHSTIVFTTELVFRASTGAPRQGTKLAP